MATLLKRAAFSTSSVRQLQPGAAIRVYRYVIDVHGQLFLHDTVPKNMTSCFKNTQFLDFFFSRIRPNPASVELRDPGCISRQDILRPSDASNWSDVAPYNGTPSGAETKSELWDRACEIGNQQGYQWISPCGPELNLIRTQDTPIVYHELLSDGNLRWAGTKHTPFRPDALLVDPHNGYLYHPSPTKAGGKYSLLGSNLVLSRFADGLEIDPDAFSNGQGGSIEYNGRRFSLALL